MPGVGSTVGSAAATGSWDALAVAASGLVASCAKPAEGACVGWAAAGVVVAGELAGPCAAAGVSQAAAKAIAHPIRLISTPDKHVGTGDAGPRRRDCSA